MRHICPIYIPGHIKSNGVNCTYFYFKCSFTDDQEVLIEAQKAHLSKYGTDAFKVVDGKVVPASKAPLGKRNPTKRPLMNMDSDSESESDRDDKPDKGASKVKIPRSKSPKKKATGTKKPAKKLSSKEDGARKKIATDFLPPLIGPVATPVLRRSPRKSPRKSSSTMVADALRTVQEPDMGSERMF